MTSPLNAIHGLQFVVPTPAASAGTPPGVTSTPRVDFQQLLLQSMADVNALERAGQAAIQQNLAGGDVTQVEAFSAVNKADLALRMLLQVRNQVLEAYDEIKQMQL